LLSSTLGITVVVGFPFIASPESPCALHYLGLERSNLNRPLSSYTLGSLTLPAWILRLSGNLLSYIAPVPDRGHSVISGNDRRSFDDCLIAPIITPCKISIVDSENEYPEE